MATEPFLINPYRVNRRRRPRINAPKKSKKTTIALAAPKRVTRKKRGRAKLSLGPRHRPVLYGTGSSWIRSPWSSSKSKGIKLNPSRRKRSRKNAPRRFRRNVFRSNPGASMLIAGANPFRKHSRSRRRLRKNPAFTVGGFDFVKNLPAILTGAASAIAITAVPSAITSLVNIDLTSNPLIKYGAQAGVVAGGGYAMAKYMGVAYAYSWILAGSAVVVSDILKTYVFKEVFPFMNGFGAYAPRARRAAAIARPFVREAIQQRRGISAFPMEGNYLSGVGVYSNSEDENSPY